ncbi:hypothetical protein NHX12_009507 [Muraenolepis orangiensis]|uniref:Ig-like domain-containing protein n=1 Tax=Muraenolepis orangiensis TaxID=630683 RepID=A0A9Q0DHR3_9TELE|nr:hypothetical protein NHX12_009507 [Muraenolepis orangiensis]
MYTARFAVSLPEVEAFQLEPLNASVLRGSTATFNARVTGAWSIMTWDVDSLLVLTILKTTGPMSSAPRYQARNISTNDMSAWEFSIVNVTRKDSGPVVCRVQGPIGARTAQLSVQVDIVSGNLTVNQDEEATFRCEASGWFPQPAVSWWLGGVAVNPGYYNTSFNTTTLQGQGPLIHSASVLRVQAVQDARVQCWVSLPASTRSDSVYLAVVPKPTDWTVLIAVVVSFGGFALLVLLILGIIFCCKRKKEKGETSSADSVSGRESPSIYQISPVVNQNQNQNQTRDDGYDDGNYAPQFRKHRHVTIV